MKHLKLTITAAVVLAAGIWLMQPEDPERTNPFDGEAQLLSTGILSPQEGLTLALERRTPDGPPMYCWSPSCKGTRFRQLI